MKIVFLQIFILCITNIFSLNISLFKINHFEQNSKLYYVNAMNNIKGNIYFEFWGENDSTSYFFGINYKTEEYIIFKNNNNYFSISANSISKFHESIIVNDNENDNDSNINILSMNAENFDFINFENEIFSSKQTKNFAYSNDGIPSLRNSLIKLNNNNNQYIASLIMHQYSAHYPCFSLISINSNSID